ncbi:MAG: GLUG motif-containing protein [Dehalococcoidia bacterium]
MRTILNFMGHHYLKRVGILLIVVVLVAGIVGCGGGAPAGYDLTMAADPAAGGTATDETNGSPYTAGAAINIKAEANAGYEFAGWTATAGTFADVNVKETTFTMPARNVTVTANFAIPVWDWYDLDAIRDNLSGSYVLMNDLDSPTAGYEELAGPTANEGKGWQPIGYSYRDGGQWVAEGFEGTFDGQAYEMRGLFIDRPDEDHVGLFGVVDEEGVIENIGLVNVAVTGDQNVGGLVGLNLEGIVSNSYASGNVSGNISVGGLVGGNPGSVSNSYASANVTGIRSVGGLVGSHNHGTVDHSYATGSVTGEQNVGGLVGFNYDGVVKSCHSAGTVTGSTSVGGLVGSIVALGTVYDSYATGSVTGDLYVGGLVGENHHGIVYDSYSTGSASGTSRVGGLVGTNGAPHQYGSGEGFVSNSYSTGSVTGDLYVGGLVGGKLVGIVSNSHYNCDEALINGEATISIGALFSEDFEQWLANGKFLDIDDRLSQEDSYYLINDVSDFKELLAFGQDDSLKFRLESDLDLAADADFYVPYLAGEFRGNGHKIMNLSLNLDSVSQIGLFGYLAWGGKVSEVGVENVNITGNQIVDGLGGLVGLNHGTVNNSYATGSVTYYMGAGGLVGWNWYGTVSNSYSAVSVSGPGGVGGLIGFDRYGTVSNSFWDIETSGQAASDGGTGKTTAEMMNIATFTDMETQGLDEPWDITAVASGVTDMACIWNIVDGQTYPFLSGKEASEHDETIPADLVGVKAGDWVKVEYTDTDWPAGVPSPGWLKLEFLCMVSHSEGTGAVMMVTMRMSDGTEETDAVYVDIGAGGGEAFGLAGFVIPANLTTGDSTYLAVYGDVTIAGETTRTYAGASRAAVYASFSQYGVQLTYYWDKETGVMVEASSTSAGVTVTARVTETNLW